MSPSCQPYTILSPAPKDSSDPRAKSFLHLINNILPSLTTFNALPGRLLVENVAGFEVSLSCNPPLFLLNLDYKTSLTRQSLITVLSQLGYNVLEFLLTPLAFGIPNSRLRYYLLARFEPFSLPTETSTAEILRCIPGRGMAWTDGTDKTDVIPGAKVVRDYLDREKSDLDNCAIPPRVLEKWGRLFDIVLPVSRRTCCFTRGSPISHQFCKPSDHLQGTPRW